MTNTDLEKKEALVDEHIRENRTQEAVGLLCELIVAYAEEKNFEKAEALHEKLYDVDPMAITEIVRAGDAIEKAKSRSVDKNHMEIWSGLYERLSSVETNCLYYSMKSGEFEAGEVIAEQGEISDRLYFIRHGEVKAVFRRGSEEIHLNTLGPGDIFGYEQFFSPTVCTVSMIAQSGVKAEWLERDVLTKWKDQAPALESRLYDFCRHLDRVKKEIEKAGVERREHTRVSVGGKIVFQLFDSSGNPLGKAYKGELSDISAGGLSFLIKSPKPESVRILLGRRLRVESAPNLESGASTTVKQQGRITAAHSQGFDDYSIHMRFDKPLADSVIWDISRGAASDL